MQIWLNSNLINIADDTNLAQLIESQNYDSNRVAAEVDMQIVPRTIWNEFKLKDQMKIEIVEFVGGG
ncbi:MULTISPECIES: sulfur carrier protein ThiS [Campylobacter]|jgi:sulfur carrier protein|uniref:sulfur carrier protein ThiS n=1 Tax=Campylobacter TaxID=194 RepID=UPI000A347556|nr:MULTISPECIES: sulfur carrier protein ThiS [unclassified Campylobacter]MBO7155015.1 sulfur carrier protein ThiS [Campylobacter sp.]MBR2148564.1 sulfur carrier protein ThiS [Campylobacter sp.]MBR2158471.1 sulfur carrier protein ThiS [Campylobacter sp.]MBR2164281.1 sulfur carrier protein ThiS [Campylobacter sp.]MBR2221410.1 sulfur carrier protein ThiS [Campylobacter sp.]